MSPYTFDRSISVIILRLWREAREPEDSPAIWRGEVEMVGSGERYYVKNLDEIMLLIHQQLEEMGIDQSKNH